MKTYKPKHKNEKKLEVFLKNYNQKTKKESLKTLKN